MIGALEVVGVWVVIILVVMIAALTVGEVSARSQRRDLYQPEMRRKYGAMDDEHLEWSREFHEQHPGWIADLALEVIEEEEDRRGLKAPDEIPNNF